MHERKINPGELSSFEGCFLTGTAAEIVPIVEVDARSIGEGTPGTVTAQFLKAFKKKVSKNGVML